MKKNTKVGVAVAGIVALIAIMLYGKKSKAAALPDKKKKTASFVGMAAAMPTGGTIIKPTGDVNRDVIEAKKRLALPQVGTLTVLDGPDPYKATGKPVQGRFYIVKTGDTLTGIMRKAGFNPPVVGANKAKAHFRNAWIGQHKDWGLRLVKRFLPMEGKENLPYAWETEFRGVASSSSKFPAVYLPTEGE